MTSDELLRSLPSVARNDVNLSALAQCMTTWLLKLVDASKLADIWYRIDELPENVLDALAHDMKVDWWDTDYELEKKRQLLKDAMKVHRRLGTRGSVETAINAIFDKTTVQEWFEYSGQPFHFRLQIRVDPTSISTSRMTKVLETVKYYKNVRSVLDSVDYYSEAVDLTVYDYVRPMGACGYMYVMEGE